MKSVPPFPQLTSQLKACLTQQKEEPDKGQAMMIPMPRNKPESLIQGHDSPSADVDVSLESQPKSQGRGMGGRAHEDSV